MNIQSGLGFLFSVLVCLFAMNAEAKFNFAVNLIFDGERELALDADNKIVVFSPDTRENFKGPLKNNWDITFFADWMPGAFMLSQNGQHVKAVLPTDDAEDDLFAINFVKFELTSEKSDATLFRIDKETKLLLANPPTGGFEHVYEAHGILSCNAVEKSLTIVNVATVFENEPTPQEFMQANSVVSEIMRSQAAMFKASRTDDEL